MRYFLVVLFSILGNSLAAQENTLLSGYVRSEKSEVLSGVTIRFENTKTVTSTDSKGFYKIQAPFLQGVITFSRVGYKSLSLKVGLIPGQNNIQHVQLLPDLRTLDDVQIRADRYNRSNTLGVNAALLQSLPSVSGNFESILKTLPGVSSNNELSSQYSVRGGNFDENLVYVNDVEIYRPLLIRNGQQEGLSFINPELAGQVKFSAGGFEARYGDKLSSVLDVRYLRPDSATITASLGLLGNSATFKFPGKSTYFMAGIRLKNNTAVLSSQEVKGNYRPQFSDYQLLYSRDINPRLNLSFLGGFNASNFTLEPESRETKFGTFSEVLRLQVDYEGKESDRYESLMGAVTVLYKPSSTLNVKWISSAFKVLEQERFDIEGQYIFDEIETSLGNPDFGKVRANRGIGSNLDFARNKLQAGLYSSEVKAYKQFAHSFLETGVRLQLDRINDQLNEYRVIDSAGYTLPVNPGELSLTNRVFAHNDVNTERVSGFLQNSFTLSSQVSLIAGLRGNYSSFTGEFLLSPRMMMIYVPERTTELLFRVSAGAYHQQPFYREFRRFDGTLNTNAKAQRSWHFLTGADYSFAHHGSPFKFTSEFYYKILDHLNPYKIDNLRIRYFADQQAKGYATGADFSLSGQFVNELESSFRLSFMRSREDIKGDSYNGTDKMGNQVRIEPGYLRRPSDQLINASIFFQDRLLNSPSNKVHLTLLYGGPLPVGPPEAERYRDVFKIPAYKRVDIGFSKDFTSERNKNKLIFLDKYFDSLVAYAEVFNLLNIHNTVSYLWIKDINNNQYAVPNYLTPRQVNFRIIAKIRHN